MNGCVSRLCDIDSIVIPEEMLDISVDEQQVEAEVQALAIRYAKEKEEVTAEKGDLVMAKADADSYPDGRTILLYTGVEMPEAAEAAKAVLGKSTGDQVQTTLAGKPVTLTINKVLRRIPVEITDDLIAGIGLDGVSTIEDYKGYVREKLAGDLQMEAGKMVTAYMLDQMTKGSAYIYDETEMEAYIDAHMDECMAEYAAEGETADPDMIREGLIGQMKQNWMAEAFCKSKGIEIDRKAAEDEADQMIEMMQLMGEEVPDRAEMIEMSVQDAYFTELLEYIDKIMEEKTGGAHGNH